MVLVFRKRGAIIIKDFKNQSYLVAIHGAEHRLLSAVSLDMQCELEYNILWIIQGMRSLS